MKKIIFACISLSFLLSSCGTSEVITPLIEEKKPFLIETQLLGNSTEFYSVEKSARLTAGSSLTLAAESVGEVSTLWVKEWTKIKKGMKLIWLRDTINSYDIRVAQAKNSVSLQDASIDTTKVNLDKAVVDTQIAYDQAKRTYDTLISKTGLSYDTIVNANQKTFDTLDANYKLYLADIEKNLDQVLYQSDQILGLSTVFENTNNNFESQLGARVGSLKVESDNSWWRASAMLADIRAKKLKMISPETAQADVEMIQKAYEMIIKHIDDMIYMLQNNVISGSLSQEQNNAWLSIYSGYRSSVNGGNTGFTAWKNQILTFLKNYKLNELATKVAIESLDRNLTPEELALIDKSSDAKLLYNTTIIDIKDRIAWAKLALQQAENARDTAEKSRTTTLAQLWLSRQSGVLSLEQAEREYSKLSIVAPFDGVVTRVIATVWQRVSPGSPMVDIVSNLPEVVIDLDAEIALSLSIGDDVWVRIWEKSLTWTISAISRIAGNNLLYTTRVTVPGWAPYIGTAVSLLFMASQASDTDNLTESILLPLRAIKIISEQEGQINILGKDGAIIQKTVWLGRISGDNITITDILDRGIEIILSDISNFDSKKFFLQKNK